MKITIKAEFITHGDDGVTIDIPGIKPLCLEGLSMVRAMDPETGRTRDLTRDEVRDFENAMDDFSNKQMAKQLSQYISHYH